ncbi:MAG: Gfo/Idh/MocA family oxidoreductase [Merdibacter sp.]
MYAKHILNKGKHVICEKPFTSNKAQCAEPFALLGKRRFLLKRQDCTPQTSTIRELLPKLGDIARTVQLTVFQPL